MRHGFARFGVMLFLFVSAFCFSKDARIDYLEYLENTKKAELNLSKEAKELLNDEMDKIYFDIYLGGYGGEDLLNINDDYHYKLSQYSIEVSDIIRKAYSIYINKLNNIVYNSYVSKGTSLYEAIIYSEYEFLPDVLRSAAEETKLYLTKRLPESEYTREFTPVDLTVYIQAALAAYISEYSFPTVSRALYHVTYPESNNHTSVDIETLRVSTWKSIVGEFINILPGLEDIGGGWFIADSFLATVNDEVIHTPLMTAYYWKDRNRIKGFVPRRFVKFTDFMKMKHEFMKMEGQR